MKQRRKRQAVLLVVLSVCVTAIPTEVVSQAPESTAKATLSDLAARKDALIKDSADLQAIEKSQRGVEFDTARTLNEKAMHAAMEIDATIWFFAVYSGMECDADREKARTALKNRLGFYAHLLDIEADQISGHLGFTKLPATAQMGTRLRDELRAAKGKMDEIAKSLGD